MSPSSITLIDSIPLTANGKVDRHALPAPDGTHLSSGDEFVAPRSEVEAALCKLWADVIGADVVGVNDNFFELGGDSIQSIQIIARARAAGYSFTAKQLFEHQTVAELAPYVGKPVEILAAQGVVTGTTPLVPAQLWFLDHAVVGRDHFNQSMLLEVPPDIDRVAAPHLRSTPSSNTTTRSDWSSSRRTERGPVRSVRPATARDSNDSASRPRSPTAPKVTRSNGSVPKSRPTSTSPRVAVVGSFCSKPNGRDGFCCCALSTTW